VEHAWHLYVLRLRTGVLRIGRDRFIEELATRNIGTSVHFMPIHLHPYYRDKYGYNPTSFPVAYDSFQRMLSLPLNPRLSDQDVSDVIDACAMWWRAAPMTRAKRTFDLVGAGLGVVLLAPLLALLALWSRRKTAGPSCSSRSASDTGAGGSVSGSSGRWSRTPRRAGRRDGGA